MQRSSPDCTLRVCLCMCMCLFVFVCVCAHQDRRAWEIFPEGDRSVLCSGHRCLQRVQDQQEEGLSVFLSDASNKVYSKTGPLDSGSSETLRM